MPKMHISKTIAVNAPVERVYAVLADFSHWSAWSPWLITEPGVKVTVADDKRYYEWEGKRTGSGNMRIVGEVENKSLDIDLLFLKPWKSKAKVYFNLKAAGEGTEIEWSMDSSLPFFLFWMKNMMQVYIGMDYDRGLRMVKDYIEDGEVHCKLTFNGREQFMGAAFVGLKTECTMDTMAKKMAEDMPKLAALLEEKGLTPSGPAFTQYHKWDLVRNRVSYTAAVPVAEVPVNLPSGFISGSIPAVTTESVTMEGPYHHLGNAWSTLYSMQRGKEIKVSKLIHPFEEYHNSPHDTPANELLTKVRFPVQV